MRLSTIKLAGFKSFVDPTILPVHSNLVGIVGPNGCGKSNIIDAVRWVMGESSARSLRGDAMTDVIFNGAANRKPVGQASLELVFDNSQGRLSGPWSQYAEIAIKRVVSRDGQSVYSLNGTRCRRRDIADLFLGTGLGPRSYAIIEQGMISRVIESRPEELRVFLEEAAGISKYKERRHETETRIRHTRDNLERLTDVRDELGRQLQHLERQAKAAGQYRDYRAQERRLKAELLTLRWRQVGTELQADEQRLLQQETVLESIVAEQRQWEARLEVGRVRRAELNEAFNLLQGRYYQASAEISRLEHYLQHQRDLQRRRDDEWQQTLTTLQQLDAQQTQDEAQQGEWLQALAVAEPALQHALQVETEAATTLLAAESALREGQAAWEAFTRRNSDVQRQIEVERTRIEHLKRQLTQSEQRLARVQTEQTQLAATPLEGDLVRLQAQVSTVAEVLQHDQAQLAQLEAEVTATREALRQAEQHLRLLGEQHQAAHGRLSALHTLQETALGRHANEVTAWLRQQHLAQAPRLAEQLVVQPGWERAVEAVLATWLDAVCVPDLDTPARRLAELKHGRLTLLEQPNTPPPDATTHLSTLAMQVQAPWPLSTLLAGVETASHLDEVLSRRSTLRPDQTLVTPDGVIASRHWLRFARGDDDQGVLQRERDLRELETTVNANTALMAQETAHTAHLRARLHDELEPQQRALQQTVNQHHRDHARLHGQFNALQARIEQAHSRHAALTEEHTELQTQIDSVREQSQLAQSQLAEALRSQESLGTEQVHFTTQRAHLSDDLRACRSRTETARQAVAHQKSLIETLKTRLTATQQALERVTAQQQQQRARKTHLSQERSADADAALASAEDELAHWLETQLAIEADVQQSRQALADQDAELAAGEQARTRCERHAETQRRHNEAQRLTLSEARIRQQNLREQLHELGTEPETVQATLAAEATESEWLARLEQLARRIQRLGPINLAAIEECAHVTERKTYLDAQNADLLEALTTLETAIHKIDRETRTRFQETFDRVNAGLMALFPRLFGGGQGHLELTGQDVLDAGVAIMVKPPGKRIGSISLLSGGEKALTAIALVFAIFQLNPAPFCLLDEVDAPLDEANIGRFGALVRELSAQVQFIFVTHNKATMEIAQHLIGVTMQEPGVSRLVTVDVEAAARLARLG